MLLRDAVELLLFFRCVVPDDVFRCPDADFDDEDDRVVELVFFFVPDFCVATSLSSF